MIFPDAVCSECGQIMEKEVVLGPRDRVVKVVYRCENEIVGCSYQVESDQRLNGMCLPVKREPKARSAENLKAEKVVPAMEVTPESVQDERNPVSKPEDTEDAAG